MNAKLIGGLITLGLFVAGGGYYVLSGGAPGAMPALNFTTGSCAANDQIAAATRDAIARAAKTFVETFTSDPANVRKLMSRRGRAEASDEEALKASSAQYQSVPAASDPAVADMFLQQHSADTAFLSHAPCNAGDAGMAMVARGGTPQSAVVLVHQDIKGGSRLTSQVLLEKERDVWRTRGLQFSFSRINDLDSAQLWARAREQRAKGNTLNAHMLYGAAAGTLLQGPFYVDPAAKAFHEDAATFEPPAILQGSPPYKLMLDGEYFALKLLKYQGLIDGQVELILFQWADDATNFEIADAINKRLIEKFDATYPEWREVFDRLTAQTDIYKTDRSWTTVYSRHDGFLPPDTPAPSEEIAPTP